MTAAAAAAMTAQMVDCCPHMIPVVPKSQCMQHKMANSSTADQQQTPMLIREGLGAVASGAVAVTVAEGDPGVVVSWLLRLLVLLLCVLNREVGVWVPIHLLFLMLDWFEGGKGVL